MNFTEKSVVFLALVTKVEDDSGGIGDLSPPVAAWSPSSMLHAGLRQSTNWYLIFHDNPNEMIEENQLCIWTQLQKDSFHSMSPNLPTDFHVKAVKVSFPVP